ncbi:hypothetical protein F5148DRAFT_1313503 [Russula earlei]|uniref:Uncharacterized protein n=1 Tax=Russula earlei TaxID=71964 RepID=A0ACC0U4L5_9AGAM|nr:hypothetical protein F5148DRAFT_1313503 [Russula earlei]
MSFTSYAQTKTGQICFIRQTGYVGSAVNFKAYIDDTLACKLKNKTYSLHAVSAGEHTVRAQNSGLSSPKKSAPFKVTVEAGKITYVDVVWANDVSCQEITKNSAEAKLKTLKQNTKCSTAQVIAQATTQRTAGDSGWIERFDGITLKAAIINTSETLIAQGDSFKQVVKPNPSEVLRLYVNYRLISFYINYIPHSLDGNNDDAEKGTSKGIGLGTTLYLHHWFTELDFSHIKGYYLDNTKDFRPGWQPGDPYIQVPDLYTTSYQVAIGYNTNNRLSLPAVSSQTERQLRSAGAFIPRVNLRHYIIDDRTPGPYATQKSYHTQALLGAGYQYTFVVQHALYLMGGFTPSFGYIFSKVHTRYSTGDESFLNKGPIYQWDAKLGFGYNGRHFFAGSFLSATSATYAQGLTTAVSGDAAVYLQLFAGIRFNAPRFIRKTFDNLFH